MTMARLGICHKREAVVAIKPITKPAAALAAIADILQPVMARYIS